MSKVSAQTKGIRGPRRTGSSFMGSSTARSGPGRGYRPRRGGEDGLRRTIENDARGLTDVYCRRGGRYIVWDHRG